ncbi:MAG TPA: pitrilysin family protein [Chitinophagaceae bacterium]|nr:pitrilysin family protein [Chitinophagaceae bacterium]
MLNRTTPPPIKDAVDFNLTLKPYKKIILNNNAPVYTVNAGVEEVMMLEWVFYAGNCYEQKNIIAAATNSLLKNGTSKKTAFQINEHFEYYGAHLNRACHHETATVTLHCLSKHLNKLLPVIREILTDSIFPQQELEILKQNSKQQLSVNLQKCDFVANRLIDKYLYGSEHPYGKFNTAEAYDALQAEELREFYKNYYLEGKCIMFAAGKLPADFTEQLNIYFGDLNINKPIPSPKNIATPASQKKLRIDNDPNGVQGAIRIARPFPNRHHPDFKKVMILNTLFGGFFGSRLMANIREEKGYTYGIHSYLQNQIQQTAWMISTEAGKDVCEATIAEVYKEMNLLKEELVDEEELLLVKNYMMGSNLGDLDGPFQIINRWKNLILNNLGEEYFNDYISTIKNITAQEIKELANKYLVPEDFFELVVI